MLIPRRTDDGKGDSVSDGHEDGAKPPGYRLMLREMAADERPREKLKLRGSAALSDGELLAIILNTGSVGETVTVYRGSVNQAQVRVSEVFRDAVRQNATALVAVHNHPSGDPTPSAADVALTVEIVAAGQLLDIELLDHLIIGQGRWLSLKRLGLGFPKA